jgi:nucleoid DNA-binding protein
MSQGYRDKSHNYQLQNKSIMIELYLSQNNNNKNDAYGKYYPRVSYKQTMNIHDMAVHMAEHNTPFSEGTIEGILRDFVKCVREQTLNGNTVKVDNLAIFKVSVMGNGCKELYDPATDKTISASIGTLAKTDKTGPAVQSLKLLAQATGEYTREELNKDGKLGWTDKAAAEIAAVKAAAMGGNSGGSPSGGSGDNNGGSQNGGSNSQSGDDNSGSQSQQGEQGQQGNQNQQSGYALTIATSGSGSASVTHDGNAVTSGATLNEDDEVEISITPAEGQVPTASINSSPLELTEDNGVYTGSFAMPGQASALVISTGVSGEGGDGGEGLDKD